MGDQAGAVARLRAEGLDPPRGRTGRATGTARTSTATTRCSSVAPGSIRFGLPDRGRRWSSRPGDRLDLPAGTRARRARRAGRRHLSGGARPAGTLGAAVAAPRRVTGSRRHRESTRPRTCPGLRGARLSAGRARSAGAEPQEVPVVFVGATSARRGSSVPSRMLMSENSARMPSDKDEHRRAPPLRGRRRAHGPADHDDGRSTIRMFLYDVILA